MRPPIPDLNSPRPIAAPTENPKEKVSGLQVAARDGFWDGSGRRVGKKKIFAQKKFAGARAGAARAAGRVAIGARKCFWRKFQTFGRVANSSCFTLGYSNVERAEYWSLPHLHGHQGNPGRQSDGLAGAHDVGGIFNEAM